MKVFISSKFLARTIYYVQSLKWRMAIFNLWKFARMNFSIGNMRAKGWSSF
jgi:hypothetical protein